MGKRKQKRFVLWCAALLLLFSACTIAAISCTAQNTDKQIDMSQQKEQTFADGVFIDSTAISGMTLKDATTLLQSHAEYLLQNAAITLRHDALPGDVLITAREMQASTDLTDVLQAALVGGTQQAYQTTLRISDAALAARLTQINETYMPLPTDATFTVTMDASGKPIFDYKEGSNGVAMQVQETAQLIKAAFDSGVYQTVIQPSCTTVAPEITVADLKADTVLIGAFTTTYNYRGTAESTEQERDFLIPNRAFNVEKSAALINGVVVQPGKSFSFNKIVGDRTEANGWRQANGIFGGDRYTLQYGGGVCQVSTTLYNALLQCYPNIKILHRQKHSIPSSYVEPGLDATVDSNHIDFTFRNVSDAPLYLFSYYTTNKWATNRRRDLTVLVYGKALPEGTAYRTRVETIEEILPGEPIIAYDPRQPEGFEEIVVQARNGYVVDVYLERIVNGELAETIYICTDTYEAKTEKRTVGTMPLATIPPADTTNDGISEAAAVQTPSP